LGDSHLKNSLNAIGVAVGLILVFWNAASAQSPPLSIELNRVDQQGQACRFDWRVTNRSASHIGAITAEFVLFDKAGVNVARMAIPFGALPVDKSVLRSFQLRPFDCTQVGEALLNAVLECVAEPTLDCVAAIGVSSKDPIQLTR
jgi:hypothetical protein